MDAAPVTSVLMFLQNLTPQVDVYFGGTYSVQGIDDVKFVLGSSYKLQITFKDPANLSPGVYTDTIRLVACTESPCVTHIGGSPQTITVTYTVTAPRTAVTFSATSLSVQGDNITMHSSINQSVTFAITDAASRQWVRTTIAGNLVTNASAGYPGGVNTNGGTLTLRLRSPSSLPAGTYTDSVKVQLCLNPECSMEAQGSPATVQVTYVITGSAMPAPWITWADFGVAEQTTATTRAPQFSLIMSPSEELFAPVYARHGPSMTGVIQSVSLGNLSIGRQSTQHTITLKPPATLGSGLFRDTMEFEACFDAACTMPIPGTRYTLGVNMLVTATEGVEFTSRVVPLSGAREVAWSAANQSLYVVRDSATDHAVTQVDPVNRTVGASTNLNQTLRNVAVTPEGKYLYVGAANSSVYRLRLPALEPDLEVLLGGANVASDLATLAGQPESIVVSAKNQYSYAGMMVFDNTVMRPNRLLPDPNLPGGNPQWLVPAATPGSFISHGSGVFSPNANRLYQLVVDANGISVGSSVPTGYEYVLGKAARLGPKFFDRYGGRAVDATSGAILLERLSGLSAVYDLVVDEARSRVYVWGQSMYKGLNMVMSYDAATYQLLGYLPTPTSPGAAEPREGGKAMALWGNDGLALVNGNQLLLLSGPFFSTYRGEPSL